MDPALRKVMQAYVEVLGGAGVAGRGSETDLSDLSRSKPFQTKRICLPQKKKKKGKKDETVWGIRTSTGETLDIYTPDWLNCINLPPSLTYYFQSLQSSLHLSLKYISQ